MTLKRRSLMGNRLSKMKGIPEEEKALLVRIGDLVDATINNRGPTNPFEPHSPERRDPRLPSVRSIEDEQGVRSTVLTWDPVDASILAYYKLEITSLSTGVTKTFVSYTNRFVYKDSSGQYLVRLFSIGKNQTASPPISFIFTLAGSVMFLDGECNGPTTSIGQNSVCVDITIPKDYFVHVWVSFTYNGLADPQDNKSPIIDLRQTSNLDVPIAQMPIIQSIQVFPESITIVNIDDDSPQAEITRPATVAVRDAAGHFDTSKSMMFAAFTVRTEDADKVNRLCAVATRRADDIDNMCISAWVASSGLRDFISESVPVLDCAEADETFSTSETTETTIPFSNSAGDAISFTTLTGMTAGRQYLTFWWDNFTATGTTTGTGTRTVSSWRLDPNLLETGNAEIVRGRIKAKGTYVNAGIISSSFQIRVPSDVTPLVGYTLVGRQDGSVNVSDSWLSAEAFAWTRDAIGVEGRDWHRLNHGDLTFGQNDKDATLSVNFNVGEGRSEDYFFVWSSAMSTDGSQTGFPLSFRWNWELDGVDIHRSRTNNTTSGAQNTGRGFHNHLGEAGGSPATDPTGWRHEQMGCGIVNLTEGDHTVSVNASIMENTTPTGLTKLLANRFLLIRKSIFNILESKVRTTKITEGSGTFTDIVWDDEETEIAIESDVNIGIFFHTSVQDLEGGDDQTTFFRILQNDVAITSTVIVSSPSNDIVSGSVSTDADLIPVTLIKFVNNPGFSKFKVQMRRGTGSGTAQANLKDDGSDGYRGYFIIAELNFCT